MFQHPYRHFPAASPPPYQLAMQALSPNEQRQLITSLPKTDLHTHLDGSMRIATLIELARQHKVELPSYEAGGLKELVFKDHYANLSEYLRGFSYTCAVLQTTEAIERVAFELGEDAIEQGIRYLEARFAPQLLVATGAACVHALQAVAAGLQRAATAFNQAPAVKQGQEIPFEWSIICCAMRTFKRGMGHYYDSLLDLLPGMAHKELVSIASLEAVQAAIVAREQHGIPVTGFDLAGEEAGYRAAHHAAAYEKAHHNFIRKTVHAGEAYGPESIYEAITRCHAERIGHGTFLFASERVQHTSIHNKERFVDALAEYIATRRVTIEVCPTSNLQTIPELGGDMRQHPVKRMIDYGMAVAIATDNTLVSHTNLNRELHLVVNACDLDLMGLKRLVLNGFKGAFYPGSYQAKRTFVRCAAEQIERRMDEFFERRRDATGGCRRH